MRGGGDIMRVRDRTWMLAAGNEPGDVRHVDEQKRADRIAIWRSRGKSIMRG